MKLLIDAVDVAHYAYQCGMNRTDSYPVGEFSEVIHSEQNEQLVFILETCGLLYIQLRDSCNRKQVTGAICAFYHSVSGKSVTGSLARTFNALANELYDGSIFSQSDNTHDSGWVDIFDQLYANTHRVVHSPLGAKVVKVLNHVVAHAIYAKLGIEFDAGFFGKLEAKVIRPTIWNVANFVDAIVSLVMFLCKAGRHAMLTGSVECFFCDDVSIAKWLDKASELRKDAEFLKAPEVLSMELPEYIEQIKSAISEGKQLQKIFKVGREHTTILNVTLELSLVLKRHEASLLACSFRRAPVGVFVVGGSSIGKSTICAGLFNHYCSVRGIGKERAVMWTRTENDDYYSGYEPRFAGVLHDDAAKYRAAKVQGVDTSFADIISEINNVQFVTPQAALEDKGKIPFRSEWVGVSSNVPDLTAPLYFNCPAAFYRRFAVRITPSVKPQYRVPGEDKIDTGFFNEGEQYQDLWDFVVDKPVVNGNSGGFEYVNTFYTFADLLIYMTGVYERHIAQQTKLMNTVAKIGPEELCACRVPKSICVCDYRNTTILADEPVESDVGYYGSCESDVESLIEHDADPVAQSHFVTCTDRRHSARVKGLRSLITKHRRTLPDGPLFKQCFNKLVESTRVRKLLDSGFCDDQDCQELLDTMDDEFTIAIESFTEMGHRGRMNWLSSNIGDTGLEDVCDIVDFSPELGNPRFFTPGHYDMVRDAIEERIQPINDARMSLLSDFCDLHVARMISSGWLFGDLVEAGTQYVFKKELKNDVDEERRAVREYLLGKTNKKWYHDLVVGVFRTYFTSKLFRCFVGIVVTFPGVWRCVRWFITRDANVKTLLTLAAKRHDESLQGTNKIVRVFLAVGGAALVLTGLIKLFQSMKPDNVLHTETRVLASRGSTLISPSEVAYAPSMSDVQHTVQSTRGVSVGGSRVPTAATHVPTAEEFVDLIAAGKVSLKVAEPDHTVLCPVDPHAVVEAIANGEATLSVKDGIGFEVQMDLNAVGKLPMARETEKRNVWVVPERNITFLDVDPRRPHSSQQLELALRNNACYAEVRGVFPQGKGMSRTRVLMVDSETMVINNHALPVGAEVTVWLGAKTNVGVQPSVSFVVSEEFVTRHQSRDLAIVNTLALPHRFKDIKHMIANDTYSAVGSAFLFIRNKDGTLEKRAMYGTVISELRGLDGAEGVHTPAWCGRPASPTVVGDCGSPLGIENNLGCVIVGIHAGYHPITDLAYSIRISRSDFGTKKVPEPGITTLNIPLAQSRPLRLGPDDKLYTDYHKEGRLMTHGKLHTFIARPKFTGRLTPHASYIFSHGNHLDPLPTDCMAAPKNAGWKQPQMVLVNYLSPTHSMNESILRACGVAYFRHVQSQLTEQDWQDIHPMPIDVAVNGYPGIPNVDAQKHTTSAGHGRRGPKLRYMTQQEKVGVWESYRMYTEDLISEISDMRENLRRGVRPHAIYDACFKDELLSKAKVDAGRARVIYMCPVSFLVNMRMSTMGICRVLIRRGAVFGMAIGLNTHSESWDDAYRHCEELPGDNWIASDFQAFESVLSILISNTVSKFFVSLAAQSGNYDEHELLALETLLADICNPTINFFGELITLLGGEASGQQLTTPFNCVANNLLHMYAYVMIRVEQCGDCRPYGEIADDFFKFVRRNTLGDDVYLKVHPSVPEYNHTTIQKVFSDIGITYTMADKGAASKPYVPLSEVTFLKRRFVDHEEFPGMKVAALEKKSIYKMLCYTVPSKTTSNEEQWSAACSSAAAEAFFHGRPFYDAIVRIIHDMPKSHELTARLKQQPLPTWDAMIKRFIRSSPKLMVALGTTHDAETEQPKRSYCHWTELELQADWRVDAWGSTDVGHYPGGFYRELPWRNNVPGDQCRGVSTGRKKKDSNKTNMNTTPKLRQQNREMTPAVVQKVINKLNHKQRTAKRRAKWDEIEMQSDIVTGAQLDVALQPQQDEVQQTTEFVNEPVGVKMKFGDNLDGVAGSMTMPQGLGEYLTRPRLISTFTWAENTASGVKATLYPWQLYFGDTNMVDKLRGFSLLRAKLHVKALINGSPFYYGSLCAVYTPLDGWRRDTVDTTDLSMTLIASSQKPHMWLDNQNCSTAQMELPFIFPYPFLDFTSTLSLRSMGKLQLIQYAPLLSANGVSGNNIDVQIYAWAEDVQLSGPTNMPIVQSEFIGDTQLSTMASTVANVAGKLESVPIIGPYAKATEMAASAVGSVANFFGFTNVPNVSDVAPMKPMVFQLASTELSEPTQKLSLQTKQETCIGQQLHGGPPEDDLVIDRFVGRTSYLTSSVWSTTGTPGDSLFAAPVMPNMFGRSADQIAYTPLGWAANHFQYWRGPIKYTFRVVRSPFHRGRLQISWDSRTGVLNQGPTLGNPNTITKVMDLDGEDEVSFVVPYMQPELFLTMPQQTTSPIIPDPFFSVSAVPPPTPFPNSNGIINVRIMNRLTAPEASSDVTLLVFVSAAEGFEFAGPVDFDITSGDTIWYTIGSSRTAIAQSDIVYNDEQEAHAITSDGNSDVIYHQVFGEKLTSFRELMHRSSLAYQYTPSIMNSDANKCTAQMNVPVKRLPPPPGVVNNGWYTGTTSAGANQRCFFTKFHPLLSIGSCYLGYKGSVNVTLNMDQTLGTNFMDTMAVRRLPRGETLTLSLRQPWLARYASDNLAYSVLARTDNSRLNSGIEGMALTNTRTNAGLSVQLPYYSSSSFQLMDVLSEYSNTDLLTDRNNDWWQIEWRTNKSNTTNWFVGNNLQTYYASGPDFDLFFFINVPILNRIQITD